MTFLQPYLLWALPLILVPVIIHLINRLRHRPQPWAAMRFLLNATQSSVSQAKLRHFLILLFRVLAVAALILFLARPLAGGWLGWALSPAPEVVLLLLDRSASMETKLPSTSTTRREQALRLWTEAGKQFQGTTRFVLIDSASAQPQEIGTLSLLPTLPSTSPTDTAADLPSLLQRALNYILEHKPGAAEVWIASDLQASNWHLQDSRWERITTEFGALPQRARFRLLTFESSPEFNSSIGLTEITRRIRNGQPELHVVLDIERTAEGNEPLKLTTIINGTRSETEISSSGTSLRWRQTIPLPEHLKEGTGSFELPADANLRDNKLHFVFGEPVPLHASVVWTDLSAARLLQAAAADMSGPSLMRAKLVAPEELGADDWTTNSLVIWQAPLPSEPAASRLKQFIQQGGVVVFFPPTHPGSTQFEGHGWGEPLVAPENQTFQVTRFNELDGPFARTEEGAVLPVGSLEFTRRLPILGSRNILATFSDGAPFLTRRNLGKGEFYFCASLPHSEWSTLGEGPVLVPMLQRLLHTGGRRLNRGSFIECGNAPAEARSWSLLDDTKSNPNEQAGIYQTGTRLVAVNRPSGENELVALSLTEVRGLFSDLPLQLHQEKGTGSDRLQGEIWRFFVIAMLLFLLVEGWLILPKKSQDDPMVHSPSRRKEAETLA